MAFLSRLPPCLSRKSENIYQDLLDVCDQLPSSANFRPVVKRYGSLKTGLLSEVACFLMYLSSSDEAISPAEGTFLREATGFGMSPAEIRDFVLDNGLLDPAFASTLPLTVSCAASPATCRRRCAVHRRSLFAGHRR